MDRVSTTIAILATIILCRLPLIAQTSNAGLTPGEYITEGGWGTLTLTGREDALRFSIVTIGANGHSCELEGAVHNGRASLEGLDDDEFCVVTLLATPEGIDVNGSPADVCRMNCGARAGFEALYLRPARECTSKAVAATRTKFKKLYDAKKFAQARTTLAPLLGTCIRFIDRWTEGWIRNDMAVTLHKLGDRAGCRAVLDPLADDAEMTDAEILESYPPIDAEMLTPIIRATRTNLALCRDK